jgi:hypothetical protein
MLREILYIIDNGKTLTISEDENTFKLVIERTQTPWDGTFTQHEINVILQELCIKTRCLNYANKMLNEVRKVVEEDLE